MSAAIQPAQFYMIKRASAPLSAEPTEVVWWTYFGDTNIGYLQNVIDAFNESQQNYHVTIEYQGKQSEMNAKIQSTAQQDLPALFSGAVENVAMYANADYCADVWVARYYFEAEKAYSQDEGLFPQAPISCMMRLVYSF